MIVNEGEISLKLNKQPVHKYEAGCLIEIPFGTLSEISNKSNEITELFVIKILKKNSYLI